MTATQNTFSTDNVDGVRIVGNAGICIYSGSEQLGISFWFALSNGGGGDITDHDEESQTLTFPSGIAKRGSDLSLDLNDPHNVTIVTATQNGSVTQIIFGDAATTFSTENVDGVRIVGSAGIYIYKNYSLSEAELATIVTDNLSALYLGDRTTYSTDVDSIYVDGLSVAETVVANLYILSLNANDSDSASVFASM